MRILDALSLTFEGTERRIELLQGDLSAIPLEHRVDLLVVSAFPHDYTPTPSSLIGALNHKGVSVQALSRDKAVDLRSTASCWLSHPVESSEQLNFERILCFEPLVRGNPGEVVGDIFRAIIPFTGGEPPLHSVAMPIVAAGDQGFQLQEMLRNLVDAAFHWLSIGLPIDVIKIVAYNDRDAIQALEEFSKVKKQLLSETNSNDGAAKRFDVFMSYSRKDEDVARFIVDYLSRKGARVFLDKVAINLGAAWQHEICEALDACNRVVAIYSPSYVSSPVCKDEYHMGLIRRRNEGKEVLFPVFWESTNLPTYMQMINFMDCRERSKDSLKKACEKLIQELRS